MDTLASDHALAFPAGAAEAPVVNPWLLLDAEQCPLCRAAQLAEDQWVQWLAGWRKPPETGHEHRGASLGFCPGHARRVLGEPAFSEALTALAPSLARAAMTVLGRIQDPAPCPVCRVRDAAIDAAATAIIGAMGDQRLLAAYADNGGPCASHIGVLLARARPDGVRYLTETHVAFLGDGDDLERLWGLDPDVSARRAARDALIERCASHDTAPTTTEVALARWKIDACSPCLVAALAEERHVRWVAAAHHESSGASGPADELCAAHLHDLDAIDSAAAQALSDRLRLEHLARLEDVMGSEPSGGKFWRRSETDLAAVMPLTSCPACQAAEQARSREHELAYRLVDFSSAARAFRHGHGFCVRGCFGHKGGDLLGVTRAHVRLLEWEAQELVRKRSQPDGYEAVGPEDDVVIRLVDHIDGRVLTGATA